MNFAIGTIEDFKLAEIEITTERVFTITTPSGVKEVYIRHLEIEQDKLIDMIRRMPNIDFMKEDEVRLFINVNEGDVDEN